MITGIADDLRRRIKTHWLAVQEGAGENRGIVAFEPGRDIDQQGETGGMRFGKAVITETFDLLEAAFGIVQFIALADHAVEKLLAEPADRAHTAKGRHRAA